MDEHLDTCRDNVVTESFRCDTCDFSSLTVDSHSWYTSADTPSSQTGCVSAVSLAWVCHTHQNSTLYIVQQTCTSLKVGTCGILAKPIQTKVIVYSCMLCILLCNIHWPYSSIIYLNKKAKLWLRNPRDATAFQIHQKKSKETMMMMMMISVLRCIETNIQRIYYGYIQLEIRHLVSEFRIRITSTYSSY